MRDGHDAPLPRRARLHIEHAHLRRPGEGEAVVRWMQNPEGLLPARPGAPRPNVSHEVSVPVCVCFNTVVLMPTQRQKFFSGFHP